MQIQLAVFKPKRTVVPVHQFLNFKRILVNKRSIFHFPFVGFLNSVNILRNSLLKTAPIHKKANFTVFSSAKEHPLCLLNLLRFSLKMQLQHSSSKIRAWVVRFLLIEIREASFINATGPILAFSSYGRSARVQICRFTDYE